jgi:phosphate transport system protein
MMSREQYRESLETLRSDVRAMGDDVLAQVGRALEALETGDHDLATTVVERDGAVNDTYLALESDCIDLFALQQPVAGDLRFVAASFKILTDLERVGDLATNLAAYAQAGEGDPFAEVEVRPIGDAAASLVDDALDAYVAGDTAACRTVAERDDRVDTMCATASERVVREVIEHEAGDDPWTVETVMDDVSRLLLTLRDLERVGDHGVNIAARTLYMVENDSELIY